MNLQIIKRYFFEIIFILIVILAAFLRLYNLSTNPVGLNQDEAVNGYDALLLGTNLHDHHGNFLPLMMESYEDWASPLLTYITVPFVKVLGPTEFSVRLPVALIGVGSVILLYLLVKKLTSNKKLALLSAFILAISPWSIHTSRFAIPPSIVPFFFLLFLIIFFQFKDLEYSKKTVLRLSLISITAGLLTYAYPTQKIFVPLLLLFLFLVYFRKNLKSAVVISVLYGFLVAPIFIPTLLHPEIYNARFEHVSIFSGVGNPVVAFVTRYLRYFTPQFLFAGADQDIGQNVSGFGSSFGFLALFFYIGIMFCVYIFVKNKKLLNIDRTKALVLLSILILFPIPASLTLDYYHTFRVIHGLVLVPIFSIIGIGILLSFIKNKRLEITTYIVLIITGLTSVGIFYKYYSTSYVQDSKKYYQFGMKDTILYLKENEFKFDKVIFDTTFINQPYMYYLFFNKIKPSNLSYKEINNRTKNNEVKNIGKYYFEGFDIKNIPHLEKVWTFQDGGQTLYSIFRDPRSTWYVIVGE
jgi:4-amino-4-deoxy-L-arabinose transferase-like glycosyltransferase